MKNIQEFSKYLVLFGLIVVFGVTNYLIFHKESIIKNGKSIYLKLAPVDPRSLMQGDYMVLRFEVANNILDELKRYKNSSVLQKRGLAILSLNNKNIGTFKAIYKGNKSLRDDEVLISYRLERYRIKLSTDSYFFEEGKGKKFQKAEYGLFRVEPSTGEAILLSLVDKNLLEIK